MLMLGCKINLNVAGSERTMVMVLGLQDQGDKGKIFVLVSGVRFTRSLSAHELETITSSVKRRFLPRMMYSVPH